MFQPLTATHLCVLVAEDDPLESMITRALLSANWAVRLQCVDNGLAAVEAAVAQQWDVVLMDIGMPVLDGFKASRRIRDFEAQHPHRIRLPIIAYTAGGIDAVDDEVRSAGIDDVLVKPASAAEMACCIGKWTRKTLVAARSMPRRTRGPAF